MAYLWIALGGALGSMARYAVTVAARDRVGVAALGTFAANMSGSFLIGFFAVVFSERLDIATDARRFVIAGLLGGYTTFSTLGFDTARFLEEGEIGRAALNGLGSLVAGVVAVFAGMAMARAL